MIKARKKLLLTGGSGYIGSVLIDKLSKKGFRIRVLDIIPPPNPQTKNNIDFVLEDIRKITQYKFQDFSSIIHLAGISDEPSSNRNPKLAREINTTATVKLAKKAKRAGVKRFIFASSASIYDLGITNENGPKKEDAPVFPSGIYSISKHEAEKELLSFSDKDFSVVILRKATVCGFSQNMRFDLVVNAMVKNVLNSGHIRVFCKGLQWRPLISIDDVAIAYYKALTAPKQRVAGEIFNIAFDNFKVADIASLVQTTLRKHFSISPRIIFEQDERKDRSYRIETQKAKDILGFIPKATIEATIIDLVRKLKQKGFSS